MTSKKLLLISLFSFLFIAGCISTPQNNLEEDDSLHVLVSIPPQQEFVEQIANDNVKITLVVPPGASPHSYEPTPSQLAEISTADLYLTVGSGIEIETIWLDQIKSLNPNIKIVDTHEGINLIEMGAHTHDEEDHANDEEDSTHSSLDPHVWLSLRNAKIMVQNSADALALVDAKNSDLYEKNSKDYIAQLDSLDQNLSKIFDSTTKKTFFVFHPAWGYFANDYGLNQEAIETLGKEPTPAQLANIVRLAREDEAKIIFASPQFSTDSANTLANQIGGSVVLISPLEKNYLRNSQKMAESLSLAFE